MDFFIIIRDNYLMNVISIRTTKPKEVVDVSDDVNKMLADLKVKDGVCHLFLLHTTAALSTSDLDPGTDLAMLEAFSAMIPDLDSKNPHDPHDPDHVKDHIMSSILGGFISIPVVDGKLMVGDWQRIVLIELSGPRDRRIKLTFIKA